MPIDVDVSARRSVVKLTPGGLIRGLLWIVLGLGLMACRPAAAREQWTLLAGTLVEARLQDSLARHGKNAAENLAATVSEDVTNAIGQVVIPAGALVGLRIAQYGVVLRPADRRYPLTVTAVTVRGQWYPISARVEPVREGRRMYGARGGVVVIPGTLILFSLPRPFTVPGR